MKITVTKFKTLQIEDYQPIKFGYSLEQEINEYDTDKARERLEKQIDGWIEEETTKVLNSKKLKENHGILPPVGKSDEPF